LQFSQVGSEFKHCGPFFRCGNVFKLSATSSTEATGEVPVDRRFRPHASRDFWHCALSRAETLPLAAQVMSHSTKDGPCAPLVGLVVFANATFPRRYGWSSTAIHDVCNSEFVRRCPSNALDDAKSKQVPRITAPAGHRGNVRVAHGGGGERNPESRCQPDAVRTLAFRRCVRNARRRVLITQ